jgi:hypothetical protein
MTYLVFLEPEAEAQLLFLRHEFGRWGGLADRFKRALTRAFSVLETFPYAFPVVRQEDELEIRRVLIQGFSKGLLSYCF